MKNNIRSIHEGYFGKRMIAMIMDAAVFAFVVVALALWVFTPIANKAFHYTDLGVQGLKYEVFSKLYVVQEQTDDEGGVKIIDVNNFDSTSGGETKITQLRDFVIEDTNFYKDRLHYYYCCYLTGNNIEYPEGKDPEEYKSPLHNEPIKLEDGTEIMPFELYTEEWFANLIEGKTTVLEFRNLANDAIRDLQSYSFLKDINKKMGNIQLFMFLPPFFISFGVFYILIPLLNKNGETLSKKVFKIGFVTKDGYDVKKRQIVFRQVLLLVWVSISSFVVGVGLTSIATLGVGVFIYLIASVISKTKRSPVDYASYVYLIDTAKSVWFHDAEEEEFKEQELDEKMSKYRKYEPNKNNIIQVGSEVVDEDIKKELEQEKVNKLKK